MGKANILIVEDEEIIADFMKFILTQKGYNVNCTVATGEEAVEIILQTRPDLVLMDIKLGAEIDGITAFEQIKKKCDIPVVYVSAYADKEMIARAMGSEPSGYLAKPFKNEQLIRAVETALAWHELHSEK